MNKRGKADFIAIDLHDVANRMFAGVKTCIFIWNVNLFAAQTSIISVGMRLADMKAFVMGVPYFRI
jgi:hypothetical protein